MFVGGEPTDPTASSCTGNNRNGNPNLELEPGVFLSRLELEQLNRAYRANKTHTSCGSIDCPTFASATCN